MAAEIWPSRLNYVLDKDSFSLDSHPELARTEFDDGPQLVRVRFSNPISIYNGTLTFTNEEFNIFRSYYMNVLLQGSRWFDMPIWSGREYTVHRVRFAKKYEVKDNGFDQNIITISLEVRNYLTYSKFALYIINLYGENVVINGMADPLQYIINDLYYNIWRQGNWPPAT